MSVAGDPDRETLVRALEDERRRELRRLVSRLVVLAVMVVAVFGVFFAGADTVEDRLVILAMALIVGGVPAWMIGRGGPNRWRRHVAEMLYPALAQEAGFTDYAYRGPGLAFDGFREMDLVPAYHSGTRTHLLEGEFRGVRLEVAEVDLRRGREGRGRVFTGLAVRARLSGDPGVSVRVGPDGGRIVGAVREAVRAPASGLALVSHAGLRGAGLEVRADNAVLASRLLDAGLAEALKALRPFGAVRAAVVDDVCLVTIETEAAFFPEPAVRRPVPGDHSRAVAARLSALAELGRRLGEALASGPARQG